MRRKSIFVLILGVLLCVVINFSISYLIVGLPENPRSATDVEEVVGRYIRVGGNMNEVQTFFEQEEIAYNYFSYDSIYPVSIIQDSRVDPKTISGYFEGFIPDTSRTLTTRGSVYIYVFIDHGDMVLKYIVQEQFMGL